MGKLLEIVNTSLRSPSRICLARLQLVEAATAASSSLLDMLPGQGRSMAERKTILVTSDYYRFFTLFVIGQLLHMGSTSCLWARVAKSPEVPLSYIAV